MKFTAMIIPSGNATAVEVPAAHTLMISTIVIDDVAFDVPDVPGRGEQPRRPRAAHRPALAVPVQQTAVRRGPRVVGAGGEGGLEMRQLERDSGGGSRTLRRSKRGGLQRTSPAIAKSDTSDDSLNQIIGVFK